MPRKIAMSVLFVAAAAGLGLYLSRGPWMAYREQKQTADESTKELRDHEKNKVDLLVEQSKIESPQGRERLARGRKWHKPGEENVNPGE